MDKCIYCGESIYQEDEAVTKIIGIAHLECSEAEDPEEID